MKLLPVIFGRSWKLRLLFASVLMGITGVAVLIAYFASWRTVVELPEFMIASNGVRCISCEAIGIEKNASAIFMERKSIPLLCVDQTLSAIVEGTNYFIGEGHVTIGLQGTVRPGGNSRLSGRGVVIGKTAEYPDGRGCVGSSARAQIETYWSRDVLVPQEFRPTDWAGMSYRKGNELYPSTCSQLSVSDMQPYRLDLSVSCNGDISYSLNTLKPLEQLETALSAKTPALGNADVGELPLIEPGMRGWWIGQVFGSKTQSWSVTFSQMVVQERVRFRNLIFT